MYGPLNVQEMARHLTLTIKRLLCLQEENEALFSAGVTQCDARDVDRDNGGPLILLMFRKQQGSNMLRHDGKDKDSLSWNHKHPL